MNKLIILLILALMILTTLSFPLLKEPQIKNSNSFTKAICDDNNYCQDYEIKCQYDKTISITPITGAAVQFNKDWEDPRTTEQIEKSCK